MSGSGSRFSVFDTKAGSNNLNWEVVVSSTEDASVQWPKTSKRGRPRKHPPGRKQLLKFLQDEAVNSSPDRFTFVESSEGQRANDPDTRRTIRAHVMQEYQRQKRMAERTKSAVGFLEVANRARDSNMTASPKGSSTSSLERWSIDPFDSFPIKMQPRMHEMIQFFVSVLAPIVYPLEAKWGLNPSKRYWVPLALTDPALLYSILYSAELLEARMRGKKESACAVTHLQQTIQSLNQRLRDPSLQMTDSTIGVVGCLAMMELCNGSPGVWRTHMMGLARMVEMRGGLSELKVSPVLYEKICQADMIGSVFNLSKPFFPLTEPFTALKINETGLTNLPEFDETNGTLVPGSQIFSENWHGFDVLDVFRVLHSVGEEVHDPTPPTCENFTVRLHIKLRSIQHHILSAEGFHGGATPENMFFQACQVGILLYISIAENDIWSPPITQQLVKRLVDCLKKVDHATVSSYTLYMWLLFTSACRISDKKERLWLAFSISNVTEQLNLTSWYDIQLRLRAFGWISGLQDMLGQAIWDESRQLQIRQPEI